MPRLTIEERVQAIERRRATPAASNLNPALAKECEAFSASRNQALQLAERILMARAPELPDSVRRFNIRQFFTASELAVFDQLAWDAATLAKEAGRCRQIIRWQGVAGSAEDRSMAEQRQVDAQSALADRGPEIEREVEALQRELRGLERDQRDAEQDVEQRESAMKTLREFAPQRVQEQHARQLADLSPLRLEIGELRSRIQGIARIAAIDVHGLSGGSQARLVAEAQRPDIARDAAQGFVCRAGWQKFVGELQSEVPALETKLAELQAQYESAQLEADATLDIYAK